jgi:hypothetical protein
MKVKKIVFFIFPIHYVFTKTLLHKNILLVDDLNLKEIKALFRARSLCSKTSGNVSSSSFPVKLLWTYCDLECFAECKLRPSICLSRMLSKLKVASNASVIATGYLMLI